MLADCVACHRSPFGSCAEQSGDLGRASKRLSPYTPRGTHEDKGGMPTPINPNTESIHHPFVSEFQSHPHTLGKARGRRTIDLFSNPGGGGRERERDVAFVGILISQIN